MKGALAILYRCGLECFSFARIPIPGISARIAARFRCRAVLYTFVHMLPVARRVFAGVSRLELDLETSRFAIVASETGRFAIRVVFETFCRVGVQKTSFRLCSRTKCSF